MNKPHSAFRKVAILVSSLDSRNADALLEKMETEQAEQVRYAIMELSQVSSREQQQVVQEFLRGGGKITEMPNSGIELDDSLTRRFATLPTGTTEEEQPSSMVGDSSPFRFLHQAGGLAFAKYLRHEHPQTIAVVVSHLPPQQAADIVTRLSPELQADVLRRVAELDEMDPEIVREIETQLETMMADEIRTVRRRSAGLAAVDAIISAAEEDGQRDVMTNLAQRDQRLLNQLDRREKNERDDSTAFLRSDFKMPASQPSARVNVPSGREPSFRQRSLKPPQKNVSDNGLKAKSDSKSSSSTASESPAPSSELPPDERQPRVEVEFDELARLDDRSLASVFQAADSKLALLALTGARREFVDRIFNQLPKPQAKLLREKMEQLGPLQLRDVERAQQQLARVAARLAEQGMIEIPTVRRFAVAA